MGTITSTIKTTMVNYITASLWSDMVSTTNRKKADKVFNVLIQAYNKWQEDEHFGVDYLFDLNKEEDLICVLKGGITSKEIEQMYKDIRDFGMTSYFLFGENHTTAEHLTTEQLASLIITNLDAVVSYILAYDSDSDNFKFIYNNYIATLFQGDR